MINQENIQEWLQKDSSLDLLNSLDSHLGHGRILNKDEIYEFMNLFPQFIYEGTGFRVLHNCHGESIKWDDSLANISWSTSKDFIPKFIREYEKIKQVDELFYQVYSAQIRGFNIIGFAKFLKQLAIAKDIYSILNTHGYENEILVIEYSNLILE